MIENLNDGRVKIMPEGEEDGLRWFGEAIEIKIRLSRPPILRRLTNKRTTDSAAFTNLWAKERLILRLDQGVVVLKEILVAVKDMDTNLGDKMDAILDGRMIF